MKYITTDNLKALYLKIKEKILDLVYSKTEINELLESINATLSSEDQEKINKIIVDGDGTKVLFDDGTYKTITIPEGSGITEDQAAKINLILSNGDGNKYLADDGTYKVIEVPEGSGITDEQASKINVILSNGDGNKYLADDGTYKVIEVPDVQLSEDDQAKLGKIIINSTGTKVLFDNGEYKEIPEQVSSEERQKINTIVINEDSETTTFLTNHGTYAEFSLKKEDQERIDMLVSNGKGNFFLSDNGSYIEMHATFTEEEYNKLKLVTDGITVPVLGEDGEYTGGPEEEKILYNDGNWKAPYTSKEDSEKLNKVASGIEDLEEQSDMFLNKNGDFVKPYEVMTEDECVQMVNDILNPTASTTEETISSASETEEGKDNPTDKDGETTPTPASETEEAKDNPTDTDNSNETSSEEVEDSTISEDINE